MSLWRVVPNEVAAGLKQGDIYDGCVIEYITIRNDQTCTLTMRTIPNPRRRPIVSRLWALERIRRRVPYAYWLFYDAVVVWALVSGNPSVKAIAFLCLGIAVFFDVVEFIIKGSESRFIARLFEGTGPPT